MTFEIAIATMHKTKEQCLEMLNNENIHCNCLIINQCDVNDYAEEFNGNQKIRIFFTTERGLSKSRNMALRNANADIIAIGDDDLYYYSDFDKIILNYYEKNDKADVVLFNMDDCHKSFLNKSKKCSFLELSGFISMQMTFQKKILDSFPKNKIFFNEYFGTGSNYVQSGEENIFLANLWKVGAKIFYCKNKILRCDETESSWFKGFTESYIKDRGAIYWAISPILYMPYIIRFSIKMKKKTNGIGYLQILRLIRKGNLEYRAYLTKQRKDSL